MFYWFGAWEEEKEWDSSSEGFFLLFRVRSVHSPIDRVDSAYVQIGNRLAAVILLWVSLVENKYE